MAPCTSSCPGRPPTILRREAVDPRFGGRRSDVVDGQRPRGRTNTMQHGAMSRFVFATLLLALGTPPPATAVDLSGDYVGDALGVAYGYSVTTVQTGTA